MNQFGGDWTLRKIEIVVSYAKAAGILYQERLNEIFKFVSNMLPLKNSTGSVMYHFMMATNNPAALRIANDIIRIQQS